MSEQPPKREYQPLFNRSYLKYLGLVVAIAIVLLSEKPPAPLDQPLLLENSVSQLHVLHTDALTHTRLLLSFSSTPALTEKAVIDRALHYQSLRVAAAAMDDIHSVLWTQDRLEITLRTSAKQPIEIANSLSLLVKNAEQYNTVSARKLIRAEKYLDNKQLDNAVMQAFATRLARNYGPIPALGTLLKATPKALLMTPLKKDAVEIIAIDRQFGTLFRREFNRQSTPLNWSATENIRTHRGTAHQLLIATQLTQTSNPHNALEIVTNFVLGELLNKLTQGQDISYRLVRQPIFDRGFQAVLLTSDSLFSDSDIATLRSKITQLPIDDAMITIKARLADNYQNLADDPQRLTKLYSKKLFYALQTQSSSEYAAQLDTITAAQIKQQINQLLGDNAIIIRLQPS